MTEQIVDNADSHGTSDQMPRHLNSTSTASQVFGVPYPIGVPTTMWKDDPAFLFGHDFASSGFTDGLFFLHWFLDWLNDQSRGKALKLLTPLNSGTKCLKLFWSMKGDRYLFGTKFAITIVATPAVWADQSFLPGRRQKTKHVNNISTGMMRFLRKGYLVFVLSPKSVHFGESMLR